MTTYQDQQRARERKQIMEYNRTHRWDFVRGRIMWRYDRESEEMDHAIWDAELDLENCLR